MARLSSRVGEEREEVQALRTEVGGMQAEIQRLSVSYSLLRRVKSE